MADRRLRVAIIIGSTRVGRVAPVVARWAARVAEGRGDMEVDVIDLAEVRLPDVLGADGGTRAIDIASRLSQADAFVVVTPEYNPAFPRR